MEQTYVMIKPDGVRRKLVGEIVSRFEKKGLTLVGMKLLYLTKDQAAEHYREHAGKGFYQGLVSFIISGPVVAMVWQGKNAVSMVRKLVGATNPAEADPGSIRGSYATDVERNLVHASDSVESARREIKIFFDSCELITNDNLST